MSDATDVGTAAVAAIRSTGATAYAPWYQSYLAGAYTKCGRFDEAWRCITDAMSASETTGERWCDAEIYRVAADITLMSPDVDLARTDAYLERALSIAREQRASSLELRAAASLARLWQRRGRRSDALNLLAPVFERFTEGFETPDLVEAKSLLESLT